jgi:hypothetical protein
MVMPQPKDQRPGRLDQVSTTKAHEHEETSKDGMGVLHPFQSQGKESSVESDEKKSTSKTSHSDVTFTVPTATSVGQSDFLNQLTSDYSAIASRRCDDKSNYDSCTSNIVNTSSNSRDETIVTNSDMATNNAESSTSTGNTGSEASSDSSSKDKSSSTSSSTPPAKKDRSNLRKGKWTPEEEEYTQKIIHYFRNGMLRLPEGTTLRGYLAEKLNCDPMRITKKFAGASCLGKRVYHFGDRYVIVPCPAATALLFEISLVTSLQTSSPFSSVRCQVSLQEVNIVKNELSQLEGRFHLREQQGNASIPIHALAQLGMNPRPSSTVNDVVTVPGTTPQAPSFLQPNQFTPPVVPSMMPSFTPTLATQNLAGVQQTTQQQQQMAMYFQSYMAAAMQGAALASGGQGTMNPPFGANSTLTSDPSYSGVSNAAGIPSNWMNNVSQATAGNGFPGAGAGLQSGPFGQMLDPSTGAPQQGSVPNEAMGVNAAMKWAQIAKLTSALSQIAQANAASYFKNEQAQMQPRMPPQLVFPGGYPAMPPMTFPTTGAAPFAPQAVPPAPAMKPPPLQANGVVYSQEQQPPAQPQQPQPYQPQPAPPQVLQTGVKPPDAKQTTTKEPKTSERHQSTQSVQTSRSKEEQDAAQALSGIVSTLNTLRENHAKALEQAKLRQDALHQAPLENRNDSRLWHKKKRPKMSNYHAAPSATPAPLTSMKPAQGDPLKAKKTAAATGAEDDSSRNSEGNTPSQHKIPDDESRSFKAKPSTSSASSVILASKTGKGAASADKSASTPKGTKPNNTPTIVSSNPSDISGDSENSSFSSKRKSPSGGFGTNNCSGTNPSGDGDSADSVSSSSDNFRASSQGIRSMNEGSEENSKGDPSSDFSEDTNGSDGSIKERANLKSQEIAGGSEVKNKRRKKSKISKFTSQNVADHTTRMDAMQGNGRRGGW